MKNRSMSFSTVGLAELLTMAVCLVSIMLCTQNVEANPGVEIAEGYDEFDALVILFVVNFPLDLLWFTAMVYLVFFRWETKAGELSSDRTDFLIRVVISSVVIAILGALTDLLAFYKYRSDWTVYFWPSPSELLFSTFAVGALLAIFATVYAMSVWIMRLGYRQSLVPAVTITAMNPVMWMVVGDVWIGFQVLMSVIAFVLALLFMVQLAELHKKVVPGLPEPE